MWFLALTTSIRTPSTELFFLQLIGIFGTLISLLYVPFWLWMLVHCLRTEPDRQFWIWILIIAPPIGPIAYFFIRFLPSREFPTPAILRRWTRGRELVRLESAAQQIGNAYQFVQWGDALREVGLLNEADKAYHRALEKEPQNLPALWGSARIASTQKQYLSARELTRAVLDRDPQYKFGDVSLAYGRALHELDEIDDAKAHFEQHVRRWRHPEAIFLLATLYEKQGDLERAREYLLAMLLDINGSPSAIARKFGRWKSRAKQLLRKIPVSKS